MRIGIVNFLNTRPLDYSFRRSTYQLVEAPPSILYKLLLNKELDCALISSVECLRNKNILDWCKSIGVCARKKVESVIYFKPKEKTFSVRDREEKINKLWVDKASRSSIALWQILYYSIHKEMPYIQNLSSSQIPSQVTKGNGAILIGDSALNFAESKEAQYFNIYDLAKWWYDKENLPFVFALWAYPKTSKVADKFFEDSFAEGWKNLETIVKQSHYKNAYQYLKKTIHYKMKKTERLAIDCFEKRLEENNLL